MPQYAMKRLAMMPILFLTCVCLATTPEEILTKRYKEFNTNILKGNSKAMTNWLQNNCTDKFSYTSYQKHKFTRDGYLSGILSQIAKTGKVLKSNTTIRSFQKSGDTIVATVASEFKGVVNFDTVRKTIIDQSVSYDTWILVGKEWKLSKIIQVNADLQAEPEGGN
jgi:hypothetical protein